MLRENRTMRVSGIFIQSPHKFVHAFLQDVPRVARGARYRHFAWTKIQRNIQLSLVHHLLATVTESSIAFSWVSHSLLIHCCRRRADVNSYLLDKHVCCMNMYQSGCCVQMLKAESLSSCAS